jgi:hypothetical protein
MEAVAVGSHNFDLFWVVCAVLAFVQPSHFIYIELLKRKPNPDQKQIDRADQCFLTIRVILVVAGITATVIKIKV